MNTKEILAKHVESYKAVRNEYRERIIPELNANKVRKKELMKEINELKILTGTKFKDLSEEQKKTLAEFAKMYGAEFSEGITPANDEDIKEIDEEVEARKNEQESQ